MKRFGWLGILFFAPAGFLFACTCARPGPDLATRWAIAENEVGTTPVIFEGKVDHIEVKGWPIKPFPGKTISVKPAMLIKFSDVHLYRGTSQNFDVETGLGGGDCGYHFKQGESYLVFAWIGDGGQLTTGICSATTLLENAGTELRLLKGEPATPWDLSDWRNEERSLAPPHITTHQLCGKAGLPQGAKTGDVTIYFWSAQEETLPFWSNEADAGADGSFCLQLDPGKYFVAAVQRIRPGFRHVAYYPGVQDLSQATPVDVPSKGSGPHVEFSLAFEQLHTVRGYLRGLPESANKGLHVMALSSQPSVLNMLEPVPLGPHGFFEIGNVPPGHYSAFAFSEDDVNETITFLSAAVEFDVSENVEGLTLEFVSREPWR
jgi:hypothetical protein